MVRILVLMVMMILMMMMMVVGMDSKGRRDLTVVRRIVVIPHWWGLKKNKLCTVLNVR